jgi:anhydro-N-acetylmuramic acid kinase
MSGTSMDGLDLAYCRYYLEGDRYRFSVEEAQTVPFDARWQGRLAHLASQSGEVFAKTHVYFGHWLGEALRAFIDRHQLQPDLVAMHGQTIFHQPDKSFTCQIGDGETAVAYLPCPLVSNFRNKDLALGGEGAPLVPLGEQLLFPDYALFLNLGGISNLSYGNLAFDVSPCNGILNEAYRRAFPTAELPYDADGQVAAQGQLDPGLLSALNRLSYYHRQPPKSLGWEWTQEAVFPLIAEAQLPVADLLYTLSVHIAQQIAAAVERLDARGESMLVTGGGRHHTFLMQQLEAALAPLDVSVATLTPEQEVWVDYKEAIIFGLLGLHTLLGQPTTLASVTGAPHDVVTGSIHLPPQPGRSYFSLA